jgi:precorrin-2/cobalt-factor-2 C20-methyltransferase
VSAAPLYGIGVGPGDPELLTLKAARILRSVPVVAYFAAVRRDSNARRVVAGILHEGQREVPLIYPVTTERLEEGQSYERLLSDFYDESAATLAGILDGGRSVAVLCEGDPFFYGSFMYVYSRLAPGYEVHVVPGVTSVAGATAELGAPLACRDELFGVLSAVLPEAELEARLRVLDTAVILKVGRNLARVRAVVERLGLLDRARYVERATTAEQRVLPLADVNPDSAPYFSMVVIPSLVAAARR